MPPPSGRSDPPNIAALVLWSSVGFALAVACAFGAAHWYEIPDIKGSAGPSIWTEPDFVCALASSVLALAVGLSSSSVARGAGATGARSLLTRIVIWATFSLFFGLLWVDHLFLFTLLVAPSHAFACLRLLGLWSRWRADVAWRRER